MRGPDRSVVSRLPRSASAPAQRRRIEALQSQSIDQSKRELYDALLIVIQAADVFRRRFVEQIDRTPVDGDGTVDLILLGGNVVQILFDRDERRVVKSRNVYDAKLDHFAYWNIRPADLDADGRDEVLLFDSKKAMFEIHRPAEDGTLRPVCRHRLFEKSISQRGESDTHELPQELEIGDVDGNGAADLIFILYDRIAIYLQGKAA